MNEKEAAKIIDRIGFENFRREAEQKFEPKILKFVVAGCGRQFEHWRLRNAINRADAHYIVEPNQFRGHRGSALVKVGTWYENRRVAEAVWELEHEGFFSSVSEAEIAPRTGKLLVELVADNACPKDKAFLVPSPKSIREGLRDGDDPLGFFGVMKF